jgi:protoheme IX farnesyltransferase
MTMTVRQIYAVFKLRIGMAIAASAVAGALAMPGSLPGWKLALLALTVLAASGAAGAFNHVVERDLDGLMVRTRNRPFVTGALTAGPHWHVGLAVLLAAATALAAIGLGTLAALHILLGALVYGVVYTVWLKRRTAWNIVVGGLSGSFAVLAGAAAVDPVPTPIAALLALVLFLWTPPHFWSLAMARREDYAAAGVPMLPVVVGDRRAAWIILGHTIALVAASLVPGVLGLGPIYLVCAVLGGAWFLWTSWRLVASPDRQHAMANFHASLIQLSLVLVGTYVAGAF